MEEKQNSLSVREVLSRCYEELKKALPNKEVVFETRALKEIASDWWPSGSNVGYMKYESVILLLLGPKNTKLALGLGESFGNYPADQYDSDILAIKIPSDKQTPEEIAEVIEKSKGFRDSAIFGMNDGSLNVIAESPLGKKLAELIMPDIKEYIVQRPEIDDQYITLDLRPIVRSQMRFKNELPDFLSRKIIQLLASI